MLGASPGGRPPEGLSAASGLASPSAARAWIDSRAPADAAAKLDGSGERFVTLREGATPGLVELWSEAVGSGGATRLSGAMAPGDEVHAFLFSPDGRRVAFTASQGGGPRRLFEVSIDGGVPKRVDPVERSSALEVGAFAFSPDSSALVYLDQPVDSGPGEPSRAPTVVLIDLSFADGFESGDTSAWSDAPTVACPAPTGGPTLHANSVPANETWTANASPHVITANVTVPIGITLTVAPCAEVRLRSSVSLTVLGTLVARGTPTRRIRFLRDNAAQAFASLWVRSPGFADLAFADLVGGGSSDAALLLEGVDSPLALPAAVDHVKVLGSAGYGVRLFRSAGFAPSSRELVVSGSGATQAASPYPVRLGQTAIGTLPTGVYTGNASDLVQVIASATIGADLSIHDRGVPYQIGGGGSFGILSVSGSGPLATLSIDPGVEIRFFSAGSNIGGLFVNGNGRLVAVGTATAPILFTGAGVSPPAGSWEGITFSGALAPNNLLDHVQIDAAGAHGGDQGFGCPPAAAGNLSDGALKLFTEPSAAFLINSTISSSSSHGIFRAWTGGLVDFLPTNSFANVAFCRQVMPKPPSGSCPVNPDCP